MNTLKTTKKNHSRKHRTAPYEKIGQSQGQGAVQFLTPKKDVNITPWGENGEMQHKQKSLRGEPWLIFCTAGYTPARIWTPTSGKLCEYVGICGLNGCLIRIRFEQGEIGQWLKDKVQGRWRSKVINRIPFVIILLLKFVLRQEKVILITFLVV